MGAFILFDKKRKNELSVRDIDSIFSNKGFTNDRVFDLSENELHLYKKQLVDTDNFYIDGENAIFVIGTIVYHGLGYHDTLKQLLADYLEKKIDYEHIIGSYCVIFYSNNKTEIMNDALNVCEIFTDYKERFISSSFLVAANAIDKLTIDREASLEKYLTGYIVGENTLFNEINRIIPSRYQGKWEIHKWPSICVSETDRNRKDSIDKRTQNIVDYLKNIEKLAKEFKPELGLSGGYDSRLVFAAAQVAWPFKLDIHTHSTEGVDIHNVEKEIVKEMAEKTGSTLRIIPTHNLDFYPEAEIESILKDGYYYFDGRCAYNMGAFSPTYTRKYKIDTMSGYSLTLNGLGGEVYRNYYMNIKPFVSAKQWMKANVYPNGVKYVIDHETFHRIHKYICHKMRKGLNFRWGSFLTPFQIRRYYCEMRMPDCDALNCNADNQLEFYLTPFIERSMIEDAYKSRNHIGVSGEYQAEMIRKLDPLIASFNSHYGYSFDRREPFKRKIYMIIRGIIPDSIWNYRNCMIAKNDLNENNNKLFFERVRSKSKFLRDATEYAEKLFPEINFEYLRTDYAMMPNSSYISIVFYMLKDRIEK